MVKCLGQKVKYQQIDFITGYTHVNYQSSSTHNSNVINNVKVFKSRTDSKVKVTMSKLLVSMERICYYKYSCEISKL